MAFSFFKMALSVAVLGVAISTSAKAIDVYTTLPLETMKENLRKDAREQFLLDMILPENKDTFDDVAMYIIGVTYGLGQHGVTKNTEKYNQWLLMAADHGNGIALKLIGDRYRYGKDGYKPNPRLAMLYYRACTSAWAAPCHFPLGELYRDGNEKYGVLKDKNKAFYHLYMGIGTDESNKAFKEFYNTLTPKELRFAKNSTCSMFTISGPHGDDRETLCDRVLQPDIDSALKTSISEPKPE